MTLNKGGIIGAVIFGGAALAAFIISSKKKKQYVEPRTGNVTVEDSQVIPEEGTVETDSSVKRSMEEAALKMTMWIIENRQGIEAAWTVISIAFEVFTFIHTIKESRRNKNAFVTLNEKEFDNYISNRFRCLSDEINNKMLDRIVDKGGCTMQRSDGVRLKMTVIPKGDPA